jgi:RHS repeat-associated protein
MGWLRVLGVNDHRNSKLAAARPLRSTRLRRAGRAGRRLVASALAPVMLGGTSLVPVAAAAAGGATVAAVSAVVAAAPAKAATGSVLMLLQNGETSAPEAADVPAGDTVTSVTPTTWEGMTAAQFEAYSALVIGDPSTGGTCSSLVPTTATSGTDALGTAWQTAVTGNVAVVGTAPALAGSGGSPLISDAIAYAAAQPSSGAATGLYMSLNCEYSTSPAATAVPLLAGVEGTGTAGDLNVTGQGSTCGNSGTVNALAADQAAQFRGMTTSALAAAQWAAPACAVEETFSSWPATYTPVAYDGSSSAVGSADFTASDGATGQPYVLLGAPVSAATTALAPSDGGEVPAGATVGGGNPAAPGAVHATAGDPVDTENGDFSQSDTDVSVPTFGPSLAFSRTYDAGLAQQQTQAGTPGPLGYGSTDNWASSLAAGRPLPGDIYTLDGTRTADGNGGPPAAAAMDGPAGIFVNGSDVYIADTVENRVEEVPGTSKTQWGIAMTAGDVYTIAGSEAGLAGASGSGTAAASSLLDLPVGLAVDSAGNLFIADSGNARVMELSAVSGTQWGSISMTANDLYVIAGRTGQPAVGNDSKQAIQSDLDEPEGLHLGAGSSEDLYIADTGNNRIQEIAGAGGESEWGQTGLILGDVYTVAGSPAGTSGSSGDGGATGSALLDGPEGVTITGGGDMYIADTDNSRIQEVPVSAGEQWGITPAFAKFAIYTVAGRTGQAAVGLDSKPATQSDLNFPESVRDTNGGNLYITDSFNNRIQEVALTSHSEFGQSMTADDVYTVAGSAAGTQGFSGNGGLGTSALLGGPEDAFLDSSGDIYIADADNSHVRELSAATGDLAAYAGSGVTLEEDGNGGPATAAGLNDPDGVTADSMSNVYVADSQNNRVQEIAASSHTQFGIAMTAGDTYTVAGDALGSSGTSGDGGRATSAELFLPIGVAVDAAGDLYIADTGNNRVQEVSAASGDISTIAGSAAGTNGSSGDGGPATSGLLDNPWTLAFDPAGNLYIADEFNNRIQEIPAATGPQRGTAMTAGDVYTIAGSATAATGSSGDGGPATAALLASSYGVAVDAAGNVFISDAGNNRIQEVATTSGKRFGQQMTAGDIYTIAGSATGVSGMSGDGGPATKALLDDPIGIAADTSGDLYISDSVNNRVQELAAVSGTQWSTSMTAGDIYTVAGSATGATGAALGDGGPATGALLNSPLDVSVDPSGSIYIIDATSNRLREVTATSTGSFPENPTPGTTVPGAVVVSQPGGSQVTFYSQQTGGSCAAPDKPAGGYCTLPQNVGATLSFSSSAQTYTYTPAPGATFTYGWNGALTGEADAAGNTLTVAYGAPAPGSGQCPSAAASCETITAASGRTLVIGSSASGRVTSVADSMGRETTYAYNSAGDLGSVTDPMGHVTSYTYGAGSTGNPLLASDLLTITDPNAQPGGPDAGDSTVNVYDAQGRVTSQTDPTGLTTTISYCLNAAAGDCMHPATGTGYVTVTDPDGNTSVDSYTAGDLTATTTDNGSTASEQDFGPNFAANGNSAGTLLPLWTADADGNVSNSAYDSAGHETSTTDPLGNVSTTAPTSLGGDSCAAQPTAATPCSPSQAGPTPVAAGGVITPPPSAPPAGAGYALYDNDGNELYDTAGVYQPGSSTASATQTTYTLYRGNSVTLGGSTVSCSAAPPSPSLACATIDAAGVVTRLAYDSAGDMTSESTPDGNGSQLATQTYVYNADGQVTSATTPDGNITGANAANFTTTTAYNSDGEQTSATQAGGSGATVTGRTTSYGYDADGNEVTLTDPRLNVTTTAYDADDGKTMITDASGNAELMCYDGDGNVAQTVPPSGVAAGSLTPASCPKTYPAGYADRLASDATIDTYDATGQVTSESTPTPAGQTGTETTSYSYDAAGNTVQITDPPAGAGASAPNQVTRDTYDQDGNLLTQTTGFGTSAASTVSACYDPNDYRTAVVAPDGNTAGAAPCEKTAPYVVSSSAHPTQAAFQTTSSYDSAGELVSTTSPPTAAAPSGATTTSSYDADGDLLSTTDPNGVTTTSVYNTPGGHVATVSYSGSAAPPVSYGYDAEGNQTAMTDGTGTSSATYDPFGELTATTNEVGKTVSYSYDADGDTTGTTYPLPSSATWATTHTVTYGYNKANLLASVTDFNGRQIAITPNADGLSSSETLGATGDSISHTYDPTDAPSAIALKNSTSTLQSFTYSRAPDGGILSEASLPASSRSPASYAYDGQGRVTSMTPGTGSALSYAFDASGNLTTLPTGGSGTYDDDGELTSAALAGTTTSYGYNADGERLTAKQGAATIAAGTWNGAGQLASYSGAAADMTAATYDGDGLRESATTGSGTQAFVWGGASALLMDSSNAYIYGTGAAPAEQVNLSTGTASYLVTDSLGSVRGVVSSAGALTASTSYDAWGNPQTAGGLTGATPFGYAGGYTDPTGLIYLVNRYYDPQTGQFLSVDPDVAQTGAPYDYADGDPVSGTDPTGQWMMGLPSKQNAFDSENEFMKWVEPKTGGADRYKIYRSANKGKLYREVDIFQLDLGWINELKIGKQTKATGGPGSGSNESQAEKDATLIKTQGSGFCHWATSPRSGLRECGQIGTVFGGTWWFGYEGATGCQRTTTALCPGANLREYLLEGHAGHELNIMLVVYYPGSSIWSYLGHGFNAINELYRRFRNRIRNSIEDTKCPAPEIDNDLPVLKFSGFGC